METPYSGAASLATGVHTDLPLLATCIFRGALTPQLGPSMSYIAPKHLDLEV